jgi:hypothetical protein
VKIHFEESGLFEELSQDLKGQFPQLELCPLKSRSQGMPTSLVFVEENLEPDQVVNEMHMQSLQYILQRNSGRFEKDVQAMGRLSENAARYFEPEFNFVPEPIVRSQKISFEAPADKEKLKQATTGFVEQLGSTGVAQAADAVIEELYMNAMLDAPREAQKKGFAAGAKTAEFFLCQTENCLQISCTDLYGSLEIQRFLTRMREVYERGAGQAINLGPGGGAGLGCVILFEHSCSLILGVQPGQKTKVTCLISLGMSNRKRTQMKKSLLWFEL